LTVGSVSWEKEANECVKRTNDRDRKLKTERLGDRETDRQRDRQTEKDRLIV